MANVRTLVVEDEAIIAKDMQARLKNLGYTVSAVVATGEEAIEKAAETRPDLVLMDIVLKGDIDGVKAAEQIRTRFNIPVIYITAYADEQTLQRAKVTEPFGYILKPFEDKDLRTTIEIAVYKHMMENRLRESNQWLATLLKSASDAVIATNREFITFMNPAAEALTGWKQEETAGRSLTEVFKVVNEETRSPAENPAIKVLREGVLVGLANHVVLVAKDGREIPIDDSAAPIRDERGNVTGVVLVFHSVAERKRLEDVLRQQAEELAKINHAKDEFIATLSHELRTPLSSMLGWARLLRAGNLDQETVARALETIERNAQAQAQLIEDLLDVSRIITGKLRLNAYPIELAPLIEAVIDTMRPAADAKGIRLESVMDAEAGAVIGDPDRLHQVVWNLLSNAIKFTSKGGHVEVRLERSNSYAQIKVSDTGQGISPSFLPYVFDRFRQANSSMEPHGGLGLGLAIVRRLVELHGGTVHAESPGEGQGATFTVRLPLAALRRNDECRMQNDELAHPLSFIVHHSEFLLDGLKVLVVDDEADARELLSTVLTQCGAKTMAVASTAKALEALKWFKPDVLVSDIGMPDEDGYALIRKVRALDAKRGGQIPAIALTGYAGAEDHLRVLSAGYQIHLPKPVDPAELASTVASLTGRTGAERAALR